MRIKVRFDSECPQPSMIIDVRFLPRVGERMEIGYRKTVEILAAARFDNDKRYDGFIRVRTLSAKATLQGSRGGPLQQRPVAAPVFSMASQAPLSVAQGVGRSYGDLSIHELGRISRELDKARDAAAHAAAAPEPEFADPLAAPA